MKYVFPERFTLLLENTNLTYSQIAQKLGLKSKGTISKYATGQIKTVGPVMIKQIADLFNVSPSWLSGFTDDMHAKF